MDRGSAPRTISSILKNKNANASHFDKVIHQNSGFGNIEYAIEHHPNLSDERITHYIANDSFVPAVLKNKNAIT